MTANTKPLSNAEKEVRNILDEAISASVTASTPGISWGKLMTVIQMQRPHVDEYISQRRKVQPIQEVNIGDSVNPFRGEIVKLICALQLTGRFTDTNTAPLEATRRKNKVRYPHEVSLNDNCHQAEHEITVSKKCKNAKWGVKHCGKGSKMHEISEENHLFNTYNDAAGGQNCGPFSFTFNVHKKELTKGHTTEQLNEPNIDIATYRNDYNSYLIARYESEYGDVNLSSTNDEELSKLHDVEKEAQHAEHDMYELKKSSTDHLCVYSKNKNENQAVSSSLYDNTSQKLQRCKSKDSGIHCDNQTSGQGVGKLSQHYHPEKCGTVEQEPLAANLFPTYSVICADSSSEHLAQMPHKNARDYTHNENDEKLVADEEKEFLSVIADSESICELYRMKEKSYCYNTMDSASKDNSHNNKILVTNDQLHLHTVADSSPQFSNVEHVTDEQTYVAKDSLKKCASPSGNTAEHLFQNFIQPEDENNIQLLLQHNFSSGYSSPHCRSTHEINTLLDSTLEGTQRNQWRSQIQGNIVDKSEESGSSILEYSSQKTKNSCDSSNGQKKTGPSIGRKAVLQEFQQVHDFQQHLNNKTSSTNTAVNKCTSTSHFDTATYECQNENSDNPFCNKKVYWSSVGLIIEDLIDSNVLPVAGKSDMTLGEPPESKAEKKSSTIYDDGSTRDQIIHIGNTNCSRPDITNGIEDSSFITEMDVNGSTDLQEKDRSLSGKLLSEDTSDKSKDTKKSQQKRSFFKSLQRVFHLSRKH